MLGVLCAVLLTACGARQPTVTVAGTPVLDPFVVETVQALDTVVILSQQVLYVITEGVNNGTLSVGIGQRAYRVAGNVQKAVAAATQLLVQYVVTSQTDRSAVEAALAAAQQALLSLLALAQENV